MINIGKPTGAVGWCGYGSGHLGRFADSENHPEIGWSPSNSCHFVEEMPRVSMAINDQESGTQQWDSLPMEDLSLINDVANHTDLSFFFLPTQCSKTFFGFSCCVHHSPFRRAWLGTSWSGKRSWKNWRMGDRGTVEHRRCTVRHSCTPIRK